MRNAFLSAVLLCATFGIAQTQEGLVNVNLSNIRLEIAKDINVDVSNIPVTIQVPVDVAANVCGVSLPQSCVNVA